MLVAVAMILSSLPEILSFYWPLILQVTWFPQKFIFFEFQLWSPLIIQLIFMCRYWRILQKLHHLLDARTFQNWRWAAPDRPVSLPLQKFQLKVDFGGWSQQTVCVHRQVRQPPWSWHQSHPNYGHLHHDPSNVQPRRNRQLSHSCLLQGTSQCTGNLK